MVCKHCSHCRLKVDLKRRKEKAWEKDDRACQHRKKSDPKWIRTMECARCKHI